jgi:hypothetical protein
MRPPSMCDTEMCMELAVHTVFWPGKVPAPKYCEKHAAKAILTLRLMGVPVNFRPIETYSHTSEPPSQKLQE